MATIPQLPIEMLEEIFRFLPHRDGVSLVNRQFYNAACAVNDNWVTFSSIFKANKNDHQAILDNIKNTPRKLSKLHFQFGFNMDMRSIKRVRQSAACDAIIIAKKFSETIKYLRVDRGLIEMPELFQILSSLPNLEHLVLTYVFEKIKIIRPHRSDCALLLHQPETLTLHQLKTLTLDDCSGKFKAVFDIIPANVLNKLAIKCTGFTLEWVSGLITRQANIKELTLIGNYYLNKTWLDGSDNMLENLKLESLQLQQYEFNSNHATILSKQTKLKSLILHHGIAEDVVLDVITNQLTELESLHLNVDDTATIEDIVKLTKLKDFKLGTSSFTLIQKLAGLDNSRITTLAISRLHDSDMPLTIDLIGALAKSAPNVKVLRIDFYIGWEIFSAITRCFNFIEVLEIHSQNMDNIDDPENRCYINPSLTELKIKFSLENGEAFLEKLILIFPNLRKLDFKSWTPITTSHFRLISDGFENMESLKLCTTKLELDFSDYLHFITNLKSMRLRVLNQFAAAELKNKFDGVFDVMKYENNELSMGRKKSLCTVYEVLYVPKLFDL